MANIEFVAFDAFVKQLPAEEQREIESGAEILAREIEFARTKAPEKPAVRSTTLK